MSRGQITSLNRANKNSDSLRTTVPSSVIKQFDLKEGDKLRWWLEPRDKKTLFVRIEPIKTGGKSIGNDGGGGNESAKVDNQIRTLKE